MKQGKHICETLKGIRSEIARANDIDYRPEECHHEGDCAGTCPACESEMRWLERQLRLRQKLGKAVSIAGLSVAIGTFATSCNFFQPNGNVVKPEVLQGRSAPSIEQLAGDVPNIERDSLSLDSVQCSPKQENKTK